MIRMIRVDFFHCSFHLSNNANGRPFQSSATAAAPPVQTSHLVFLAMTFCENTKRGEAKSPKRNGRNLLKTNLHHRKTTKKKKKNMSITEKDPKTPPKKKKKT